MYVKVRHQIAFIYNGMYDLLRCTLMILVRCIIDLRDEICKEIIIFILAAGQVVLDVPLPLGCPDNSGILCVKPVAVPHSTTADFTVKVFSLARSTTRSLILHPVYFLNFPTKCSLPFSLNISYLFIRVACCNLFSGCFVLLKGST